MIDCRNVEIRDLLPDMLHNNLSAADRKRVNEHLATCAECTEELQLLRRVYASRPVANINATSVAKAIAPYRRRPFIALPPAMRIAASIAVVALGAASYSIANRAMLNGGSPAESLSVAGIDTAAPGVAARTSVDTAANIQSLDDQAFYDLISRIESLGSDIGDQPRRLVKSPVAGGNE